MTASVPPPPTPALPHDPKPGHGPRRVDPAQRSLALGLLLTGRPRPDAPAAKRFADFAHEHNLDLSDLWTYQRPQQHQQRSESPDATRHTAAALVVPSQGRTGMLFVSPITDPTARLDHVELVRTLCDHVNPARIRLVQALLEPSDTAQARLLKEAGLIDLAMLTYLQAPAMRDDRPLELPDPAMTVTPWSDQARPRFAAAIQASYQDTLDCPGLLGLRSLDDVIEGHMSIGQFDPKNWLLIERGDDPVGILLLSPALDQAVLELVYLGITPPFRGQGLGRRLVRHGLRLAGELGLRSMTLAVDEANTPARRLYKALGFNAHNRKHALIYPPPTG